MVPGFTNCCISPVTRVSLVRFGTREDESPAAAPFNHSENPRPSGCSTTIVFAFVSKLLISTAKCLSASLSVPSVAVRILFSIAITSVVSVTATTATVPVQNGLLLRRKKRLPSQHRSPPRSSPRSPPPRPTRNFENCITTF